MGAPNVHEGETTAVASLRRLAPRRLIERRLAASPVRPAEQIRGAADRPNLSVLTVCTDGSADLAGAAESIVGAEAFAKRAGLEDGLEWIVVVAADGAQRLDGAVPKSLRDRMVRLDATPFEDAATALRRAARAARGDWLVLLGPDDRLHRSALAVFARACAHRPELRCFLSGYVLVDGRGRVLGRSKVSRAPTRLFEGATACGRLFAVRRALHDELGGFDPALAGAHDYDLALRAALAEQIGSIPARIVRRRPELPARPIRLGLRKRLSRWWRMKRGRIVDPSPPEPRTKILDALRAVLRRLAEEQDPDGAGPILRPLVNRACVFLIDDPGRPDRVSRLREALARERSPSVAVVITERGTPARPAEADVDFVERREGETALAAAARRLAERPDATVAVAVLDGRTTIYPGFVDRAVAAMNARAADALVRPGNLRLSDGRIVAGPRVAPADLSSTIAHPALATVVARADVFVAAVRSAPRAERPEAGLFAALDAARARVAIGGDVAWELECETQTQPTPRLLAAMRPSPAQRLRALADFDFDDDTPTDEGFASALRILAEAIAEPNETAR